MATHRAESDRLRWRQPSARVVVPARRLPSIEVVDAVTKMAHQVSADELVTGHQRGDFVAFCGARFQAASRVVAGVRSVCREYQRADDRAHTRGGELGSTLLDWAARSARQAGKSWLRLDAWKSNPALHQYYLDRGFTLVRINDNPADSSGACFPRPAMVERHAEPDVVHDNTTKNRELPPSDRFTGDRR